MKNLIDVDYDKFQDIRVTEMQPMKLLKQFYINIRHISVPQDDSLLLDIEYRGEEWANLDHGCLIININNVENIELEANESWHDCTVFKGVSTCVESCYYEIDQAMLGRNS